MIIHTSKREGEKKRAIRCCVAHFTESKSESESTFTFISTSSSCSSCFRPLEAKFVDENSVQCPLNYERVNAYRSDTTTLRLS